MIKDVIQEVSKEIKRILTSSKLNNKWVKLGIVVFLLLLIAGIVKIVAFPTVEKGEVANSVEEDWKEQVRLIDKIKMGEQVEGTDESSEDYETSIKLFFVGANEASLDLFSSVLDQKVLAEDFILKYDTGELLEKYNEAMNRLSRNGQIESVVITGSNALIGKGKRRILVDIKYLDQENPIRVGIEMTAFKEEDSHDGHTDTFKQPLISHSIWDIIKLIEREVG